MTSNTFSTNIKTPTLVWAFLLLPLMIWICDTFYQQDIVWFRAINQAAKELPDIFWTGFSLLGNGWACFALAFPLIIFAPRLLIAGVCSGIFTGIFSRIAKMVADTPRPAGLLEQSSFHIIENPLLHSAMPSGHTMTAFGIVTAIYLTIDVSTRKKYLFLFILAIMTGISRIAVGAHWPEDVLIGTTLGVICGISGAFLASKFKPHQLEIGKWTFWTLMIGSVICSYVLAFQKLDFNLNQPIQYGLFAIIAFTWLSIIICIRRKP
jgi:membrane-associated phospholipid phosphatase